MGLERGLNPSFPVVTGRQRLDDTWTIELPHPFNRRVEDGDLVFWRPGMTVYIAIWRNDQAESVSARLQWLRGDMNAAAFDLLDEPFGTAHRFAYRLSEGSNDARAPALYGFTIAEDSHVQLAVYFDAEDDIAVALELWRSVDSKS